MLIHECLPAVLTTDAVFDLVEYLIQRGWGCTPVATAPLGWMCAPPTAVPSELLTLPMAVLSQVQRDLLALFDAPLAAHSHQEATLATD